MSGASARRNHRGDSARRHALFGKVCHDQAALVSGEAGTEVAQGGDQSKGKRLALDP